MFLLFLAAWSGIAAAALVAVNLAGNWSTPPFSIQLLEAIAGHDESLYRPTVSALFASQYEQSDWDEDEELGSLPEDASDKAMYDTVGAKLAQKDIDFVNLHLVNQLFSPRIQAHYAHYEQEVRPALEEKVKVQCLKDSFGEPILDPLSAWVKYGLKIYCSELDLYALQLDKTSEHIKGFDRVLGSDAEKPILILYGDPDSDRLRAMFSTLLQSADTGKLNFVWRYTPTTKERQTINGFGSALTVKAKQAGEAKPVGAIHSLRDFLTHFGEQPILEMKPEAFPRLSDLVTSVVLESDSKDQLENLAALLNNLPVYGPHLLKADKPRDLDFITEAARKNEKLGASRDLIGMSINGALINRLETDLPFITTKLRTELKFMETFEKLGFTAAQSKLLMSKFALLSAFKESEYRTGSASNRYAIYKEKFNAENSRSGGVVFFNDMENDENYDLYSTNRHEVYIKGAASLRQGQIPPLKENVHDIIFALNLANKNQLKVFFAMSKMILDKGIPQQLGLLPLIESHKDERIANMFYHILQVGERTEGLALLYKYYETHTEEEAEELFAKVKMPEATEELFAGHMTTTKKFSLDEASVIINGVIHNLKGTNWQTLMGQQIVHDVKLLQNAIRSGSDQTLLLKDILYSGSKRQRNTRIVPKDPANIRYKYISQELIENSFTFRKEINTWDTSATFWLIGDLNSQIVIDQLKRLLEFMRMYNGRSLQIRVFNTAQKSSILERLIETASTTETLSSAQIRQLVRDLGDFRAQAKSDADFVKLQLLERNQIQLHVPTLLLNSRWFRMDKVFEVEELEMIIQYEFSQRLSILDEITNAYPEKLDDKSIMDFKPPGYNPLDWFDLLSSHLTATLFMEDSVVRTDVARFDLSSLDYRNSIQVTDYDARKPLDVLFVIDPVDQFSQKLVSLVHSIKDLSIVNVLVLIQPLTKLHSDVKVNRFYSSAYVPLLPKFSAEGEFSADFNNIFHVDSAHQYSVALDAPNHWHIVRAEGSGDIDFDNIVAEEEVICANFLLTKLAVEANIRDVTDGLAIPNFLILGQMGKLEREGLTMETMGYNQILLEPGQWDLRFDKGLEGGSYDVLSANENKYSVNDIPMESGTLLVGSLSGKRIHVRARKLAPKGSLQKAQLANKADINVFTIARGHTYEELMSVMMLSVKKCTNKRVKFWILEDYLSESIRSQLEKLSSEYDFEYQFVSYKWPVWLRQQNEAHRQVWAYKILFLDVLFPSDVERVIFVDADQIARADLMELMETDLKGAPYAFVPMCSSREEMEGYRFWKHGYWKNVLGDDLQYHISALYVVDLVEFRDKAIGDKLRSHYQKLSSDPSSLANLDQDLPNNMQRQIPIHSLPQDWLWCETWCSDALLKTAKMIDMCNDPTSTESKLKKAKRLIPEWKSYVAQLSRLSGKSILAEHDEL